MCFFLLRTRFSAGVMNQFEAAGNGNIQQLRVLLTVDNVDDVFGSGWTALHYSTYESHYECVKHGIEMGANVNARDSTGWTPLYMASMGRNIDIVRALLDANAIVDAQTDFGATPLVIAIKNNSLSISKLLIDRGANASLTHIPFPECQWVDTFIESRSTCRSVAIIVIGMRKYHRTNITGNNDVNVLKLVSKHVWSSRMDDCGQ
jgi:ankyrin repeat protein